MGTPISLSGDYFEIYNVDTFNITAPGGVIDGPETGYFFYVSADTTVSNLNFMGNGSDISTLTFNCPVIFSTRNQALTSNGNGKTITIMGNVTFNKGVRFETAGRHNTHSSSLSKYILGSNVTGLTMICKYVDGTVAKNLVPFDVNGYGTVEIGTEAVINVHAQPHAGAALISQLTAASRHNIVQAEGHVINAYLDSQMEGFNYLDLNTAVQYPDNAPVNYQLYITADLEIQLIQIPENLQIVVDSPNVTLTEVEFNSTARIHVTTSANITFEYTTFMNANPLLSLSGYGSVTFGNDNTLYPLDISGEGVLISNEDELQLIISQASTVVLPAVYNFPDTSQVNYEGFTYRLIHDGSEYDFGNFNTHTLYISANDASGATSTITINADKGVYLDISDGSLVKLQDCNIYSSPSFNSYFALYKTGAGGYQFSGATKLFAVDGCRFLIDDTLSMNTNYVDVDESNCKFYILDTSAGSGSSSFYFDLSGYNYNALYYLASRGVHVGTEGGDYSIYSNFLINLSGGQLDFNPSGGLGLTLLNDTSGDFVCTSFNMDGAVGLGSYSRLNLDLASCTANISSFEIQDNNMVPSPLLLGADTILNIGTGVIFRMDASRLNYLCNAVDLLNIQNRGQLSVILGAVSHVREYNFDLSVNDTTSEPPYTFNNSLWYEVLLSCDTNEHYYIENINGNGLNMNNINGPTLTLKSTAPLTITYTSTNDIVTLHENCVLSNILGTGQSPLLIYPLEDVPTVIVINGSTFNVHGVCAISDAVGLTESITVRSSYSSRGNTDASGHTVGIDYSKDMVSNFTVEDFLSDDKYHLFSDMNAPSDNNIVGDDKDTRSSVSCWTNLGGHVSQSFGNFYIYDLSSGKYYFPILSPLNQSNGVFATNTYEAFGRSFSITHGWSVSGIFKIDVTVSDNLPFRFGAFGDLAYGSDMQSRYMEDYQSGRNIYYHRWRPDEGDNRLYVYVVPKTIGDHGERTYIASNEGSYVNINTRDLSGGVIMYFAFGEDNVEEWVHSDITGGIRLNYYENTYAPQPGILYFPEYNTEIRLMGGTYKFVGFDSRLKLRTVLNGDNVTVHETSFNHGLTVFHWGSSGLTLDDINYSMADAGETLIFHGDGSVSVINSSISSAGGLYDDTIMIHGTTVTLNSGNYTNGTFGHFINVGPSGGLHLDGATILNVSGHVIYSEADQQGDTQIRLTGATIIHHTYTPVITHHGSSHLYLEDSSFVLHQNLANPLIYIGEEDNVVSANCEITGSNGVTVDTSGNYSFFIQAYTTGKIDTGATIMNGNHTNVYWPTLRLSYGEDSTHPYTCDSSLNYMAYSYDPSVDVTFYHRDTATGMFIDPSGAAVSSYDLYVALGYDTSATFVAELAVSDFSPLNGEAMLSIPTRFTDNVYDAGYFGKLQAGRTYTEDISFSAPRVIRTTLTFTQSDQIYIGNLSADVTYDGDIDVSGFSYHIEESLSEPTVSVDTDENYTVIDTVNTEMEVDINISRGYILPLYMSPVESNISRFFQFINSSGNFVTHTVYNGYAGTADSQLMRSIPIGATVGTFIIKFVGTGTYYEPSGMDRATIDFRVFDADDGLNMVYDSSGNSITIENDTVHVRYPLAYVGSSSGLTVSDEVTLHESGNTTQSGELIMPTSEFADFYIRYEFIMGFISPLHTYDGSAHLIKIQGIDAYENGAIIYSFADPSGCTFHANGSGECVLTFPGNDTGEKSVKVYADVPNLGSTHGGTVYFKKPDHQITLEISSLKTFLGFDETNQLIEVTGTIQTANSYFSFPGTLLVSAGGNTYAPEDSITPIAVDKGDTETITVYTAGVITSDTPDFSGENLPITITVDTSKSANIMPTTTNPANNTILIPLDSYSGSIDITFVENEMISGSGSTYTVSFNGDQYDTVNNIVFTDNSRAHVVHYTMGIQPGTRNILSATHTSDSSAQQPTDFTLSNITDEIDPVTYYVGLPVGVYTNFMPHHVTTGGSASFRVNYKLVGKVLRGDAGVDLALGNDYRAYASDLSTGVNGYVTVDESNYSADDTQYIYFVLTNATYKFLEIYAYYSNFSSSADMTSVTNTSGTPVKIGTYDFSAAPGTPTVAQSITIGNWIIESDINGSFVVRYVGTYGSDNDGVNTLFRISPPGQDAVDQNIQTSSPP